MRYQRNAPEIQFSPTKVTGEQIETKADPDELNSPKQECEEKAWWIENICRARTQIGVCLPAAQSKNARPDNAVDQIKQWTYLEAMKGCDMF